MKFLKSDDVVVLGKSNEVVVFFPERLWVKRGSNKPSRIPSNVSKAAVKNMNARAPIQPDLLYFKRLESISPSTQLWESKMSIFQRSIIEIFPRR